MKKKSFFAFSIVIALFAAQSFKVPAHLKIVTMPDTTSDNQLTPQEAQEGWKLLFDGKTINGWRTYKNIPGTSWKVKDGALCTDKPESGRNPDLITSDTYENFQLSIDWKISPQANSGIMYLVT